MLSRTWSIQQVPLVLAVLALLSVSGLFYVLWKVVDDIHQHTPSYQLTAGSIYALRMVCIGHLLLFLFWLVTRKSLGQNQLVLIVLAYTIIVLAIFLFAASMQVVTTLPVI